MSIRILVMRSWNIFRPWSPLMVVVYNAVISRIVVVILAPTSVPKEVDLRFRIEHWTLCVAHCKHTNEAVTVLDVSM